MSLTATPFIEFMVHPHPKLVDSHTQEPLVPIMHSPLSPDKLADGSLPNVRLLGQGMCCLAWHSMLCCHLRLSTCPATPQAQVIKQRARTARQVTARRSLEVTDMDGRACMGSSGLIWCQMARLLHAHLIQLGVATHIAGAAQYIIPPFPSPPPPDG